jgi:hypothetical protein
MARLVSDPVSAGELVRPEGDSVGESDVLQQGSSAIRGSSASGPVEVARKPDVLLGRQSAEEVEVLEGEPEVACPG